MTSSDMRIEGVGGQEGDITRVISIVDKTDCCLNMTTPSSLYNIIDGNLSVFNNITPSESDLESMKMEMPLYLILYFTIINTVVFLTGIIGNTLVIQVIVRLKSMRTRMNYFLMSLSVADLLVLLVCQPSAMLEFYGKDRWMLGEVMCKIVPFLEHASLHSSGLTLLTIGFERYLAICHPLKEHRGCHLASACIVITVIWLVSYVMSLPFVFITFIEDATFNMDGSTVQVCRTMTSGVWQRTYILFVFVFLFALPLCMLVFMYAGIICKLCHLTADNYPGDYCNSKTINSRKQVVNMLIAIMALFFLCLLPMRLVIILVIFVPPNVLQDMGFETYQNILSFARIMMYVNSAGNPIIYGLLSSKFRVAFRRCVPNCKDSMYVRESAASTRRTGKNTCMIPLNPVNGCNGTAI
ncbi:QRFP-like peptide receptor [Haliotis cracherodii]|uniref:QRFP-like peptide receptor n=1 Tax=Haliotis cracherodii TaxID=6455 RepID=UPI0039E8D97F